MGMTRGEAPFDKLRVNGIVELRVNGIVELRMSGRLGRLGEGWRRLGRDGEGGDGDGAGAVRV